MIQAVFLSKCRNDGKGGTETRSRASVPAAALSLVYAFLLISGSSAVGAARMKDQQVEGPVALRAGGCQNPKDPAPRVEQASCDSTLKLLVRIIDENGVSVASAQVSLEQPDALVSLKATTDYAGKCEFTGIVPGEYRLRAEKQGLYVVLLDHLQVDKGQSLEITMFHQQEFVEVMDVMYSPPTIDPRQSSMSEELSHREIIDIPYPTTRDIRNALPLMPGVLQDASGQIHVNGSATEQISDQLDGFNITQPVTGRLTLRVSADAVRAVEVQGSRMSAEYGKGSGGTLNMATGMGDDHFRFSATNFIPSFQNNEGLTMSNWTPRATFSGPLRRGRAWFFEAADGETDLDIVTELPEGADRNHTWRVSNLAKGQVNLGQGNILSAGILVNQFRADHAGLSPLHPLETTLTQEQSAYLFTIKDQASFSSGMLLDLSLGLIEFHDSNGPQGRNPYVISPDGTSGSFFKADNGRARRIQWVAALNIPPAEWHGHHEFKLGTDLDRVTYRRFAERRPIFIVRGDGTLSRKITFAGNPHLDKDNVEVSAFAQDRWFLSERVLLELGIRFDWDQIVRQPLFSPRFSSTFLLSGDGETKLVAGIGLVYDATHLDLITRPLEGRRFDFSYANDGRTPLRPPVETAFLVDESQLRAPRFLNWSVGVERKLPAAIYLRADFMQKRGHDGLAFVREGGGLPTPRENSYVLRNVREDHYDALQVSLRRMFKGEYRIFASYTRSSARSNAVLDFTIDDPIFSQQAGGPLPWDAPNRLLSWGWLPLIKGFNLGYSLEWRDGYPFSVVNQNQELAEPPFSRRFPATFSLNVHIERRFRLLGFQWAVRGGVNNLTSRENPTDVINNVDSPDFLVFTGKQHRVFTGRLRFLGKK